MSYFVYKNESNKTKCIKEFLESFKLGKNKINYLIDNSLININGDIIRDRQYLIKANDLITIDTSVYDILDYEPVRYNLNIVYEDDYLLVVDKPINTIIYNDSKDKANTLCNYVAYYYQKTNQSYQVRHTYRLDYQTTGLVVFAKDIFTHSFIDFQISSHNVKKEYYCVVCGIIDNNGVVNTPISKDRHNAKKMITSDKGQSAYTSYEVVCHIHNNTLLKVNIKTGRTHQIRVHMASINHPLVNDPLYGSIVDNSPMLLTCYHIGFVHPIYKKWIDIYSNLDNVSYNGKALSYYIEKVK